MMITKKMYIVDKTQISSEITRQSPEVECSMACTLTIQKLSCLHLFTELLGEIFSLFVKKNYSCFVQTTRGRNLCKKLYLQE